MERLPLRRREDERGTPELEAARAGFETGRNSFLALIEAERNLRVTSDGFEKAKATRSQAHAEFLHALGLFPDHFEEGTTQ